MNDKAQTTIYAIAFIVCVGLAYTLGTEHCAGKPTPATTSTTSAEALQELALVKAEQKGRCDAALAITMGVIQNTTGMEAVKAIDAHTKLMQSCGYLKTK